MTKICLHGELGVKYGKEFNLHINSVPEAIRALGYQIDGFIQDIQAGEFRILRGNEAISEEHLELRLGSCPEIHFIPVPVGSKEEGMGKVILGIVIIVAAFVFAGPGAGGLATGATGAGGGGVAAGGLASTAFAGISYGQIAAYGGMMALSGAAQLLSPNPEVADFDDQEPADERASFLFNNKPNRSKQGGSVPVAYGRIRTGPILLQGALDTIQIPIEQILNIQTNAFVEYNLFVEREGTGDTWRDWRRNDWKVEDDGFVVSNNPVFNRSAGSISPSGFRGASLITMGEFRRTSSGLFSFFIVSKARDMPRDWIVRVEIENPRGTVTQTYFSAISDSFNPNHIIGKIGSDSEGKVGTSWMWELDPQAFTMDEGDDILVRLEYFIEP